MHKFLKKPHTKTQKLKDLRGGFKKKKIQTWAFGST